MKNLPKFSIDDFLAKTRKKPMNLIQICVYFYAATDEPTQRKAHSAVEHHVKRGNLSTRTIRGKKHYAAYNCSDAAWNKHAESLSSRSRTCKPNAFSLHDVLEYLEDHPQASTKQIVDFIFDNPTKRNESCTLNSLKNMRTRLKISSTLVNNEYIWDLGFKEPEQKKGRKPSSKSAARVERRLSKDGELYKLFHEIFSNNNVRVEIRPT